MWLYQLIWLLIALTLFQPAQAQNQTVEAGCGANVGSVAQANVTITIDCSKAAKSTLSVEYSRLFGGFEVPLLMELIPGRKFDEGDKSFGRDYKAFFDSKGDRNFVQKRLVSFVEQYPYFGAHPLLTQLWTDVSGSEDAAQEIGWLASSGNRNDRICFFHSDVVDQSGFFSDLIEEHFKAKSEQYCNNTIQAFDRRIGFTFAIISNETNERVNDLNIFFRTNYGTRKLPSDFRKIKDFQIVSSTRKVSTNGDALPNLIKRFGNSRDVEFEVGRRPRDFLFVSHLEPKEKIIALLDIFVANEKNLPAAYLTGIYVLDEINFTSREESGSLKVRPPALDKAARIEVPLGWASQ